MWIYESALPENDLFGTAWIILIGYLSVDDDVDVAICSCEAAVFEKDNTVQSFDGIDRFARFVVVVEVLFHGFGFDDVLVAFLVFVVGVYLDGMTTFGESVAESDCTVVAEIFDIASNGFYLEISFSPDMSPQILAGWKRHLVEYEVRNGK